MIVAICLVVATVVILNSKYSDAVALMNDGQNQEAIDAFRKLGGYKDSRSLKTAAEINLISNASIGDIVTFGNYHKNTEWIVLDKEDGKALLISKCAIEKREYNTEDAYITWEECTLRSWLNGDYLKSAFCGEEQLRIIESAIDNSDNVLTDSYSVYGGNDTMDKVFLLSLEEARRYFSSDEARIAVLSTDGTDTWWWLRSPGDYGKTASGVYLDGSIDVLGETVYFASGSVRPALWIDISNH